MGSKNVKSAALITMTTILILLPRALLADEVITWKEKACLKLGESNYIGSTVPAIQFSADATKILAFGQVATIIWDVKEAKELHRFDTTEDYRSTACHFMPDGNSLLFNEFQRYFAIYDLTKKHEEKRFLFGEGRNAQIGDGHIHDVAMSPDGKWIAVGGKTHSATLLDAKTLKEIGKLEGHYPVHRVGFTPDSKSLVTIPLPHYLVGKDPRSKEGNIIVWDLAKQAPRLTLELHTSRYLVDSYTISSDSKLLATASHADYFIRIWDLTSGKEIDRYYLDSQHRTGPQVNGMSFSPDGNLLAFADTYARLVVIDLKAGHWICRFEKLVEIGISRGTSIDAVAFSPNGQLLAVAFRDRTVRLLEIKRKNEKKEK